MDIEYLTVCLAIPGQVIKIKGRQAIIKYPGQENPAMIADEPVKIGDMVMVQMGIIVKKLDQQEVQQALEFINDEEA